MSKKHEELTTPDKVIETLQGALKQAEQDGNTIAVLHKTASDAVESMQKMVQHVDQLTQERDALKKTAGEPAQVADKDLEGVMFSQAQIKGMLQKLAGEGVMEAGSIPDHVERIKQDPEHFTKIIGIAANDVTALRKTAKETAPMPRVGRLVPAGESQGSRLMCDDARKEADRQLDALDQRCKTQLQGQ